MRVKENLINDVYSNVKTWQKDNYHKVYLYLTFWLFFFFYYNTFYVIMTLGYIIIKLLLGISLLETTFSKILLVYIKIILINAEGFPTNNLIFLYKISVL